MEPAAKDEILNALHNGRDRKAKRLSGYGLPTRQFPWPQSGPRAPGPSRAASGGRRPGADGRAGQVGSVRAVPKHVGVGRLEELHVVLHAAVGALRLLQAVLQVLQPALVAAVGLGGDRSVGQVWDMSGITRPWRHRDFIGDCQRLTGSDCQWARGLLAVS